MSDSQSASSPVRATGARNLQFDAAKGIGIGLVVLFHAYRGIAEAGGKFHDPVLPYLDYFAYCFHMPLFFIIAGLFVDHSLRKGVPGYLRDKLLYIYYPYLLWSVITLVVSFVFARYTNTPKNLEHIFLVPVVPPLHFWFLLSLFTFYLIYAVVRDLRVLAGLALLGAVLHDLPGAPRLALNDLHFFIFFVFGVFLARGRTKLDAAWWASLAVLLVWSAVGYRYGIDVMSAWVIPAGFAGYYATIAAGRAVQGGWAGSVLNYLGERSLPIYLLHIFASVGMRTVGHRLFHGLSPYGLLVLCTFSGIAGPLLVCVAAERLGVLTWTGLGRDAPRGRAGKLEPDASLA